MKITVCAGRSICVANCCSTSTWWHWGRRCRRLNATIVHDFGLQFVTPVCEGLHGFICGTELA